MSTKWCFCDSQMYVMIVFVVFTILKSLYWYISLQYWNSIYSHSVVPGGLEVKSYRTLEMPFTDLISDTIFVKTSMFKSTPGMAGTPVMKSCVTKVLITTDLWNEVTFSMGLRSKWIGIKTKGIWLNLPLASGFAFWKGKMQKFVNINFEYFKIQRKN